MLSKNIHNKENKDIYQQIMEQCRWRFEKYPLHYGSVIGTANLHYLLLEHYEQLPHNLYLQNQNKLICRFHD